VILLIPVEAQAQCTDQPLRPIARSHVMPPNPEQVRGTTVVEVHIGPGGVPDSAKVIHYNSSSAEAGKSGVTPEMDERARQYVLSHWRWELPTHNCEVIPVSTRVDVKWN
jgi:hypothetical protein